MIQSGTNRSVQLALLRAGAAFGAMALPLAAQAQDTVQEPSQSQPATQQGKPAPAADARDIVVTGTLLRGTTPVGSNAITVGQAKLAETGAISSNELLASLPQVTNYFNRVPLADLGIAVNQIQIARPNIRNISPNNASSSATLILFDGHRIASAGVNQASIDPDVIPTGAIERVEVVTEGGSATYGADAVAGVINFITRRRFDGVQADAHYGFADKYWQTDASATIGKDWGSGSAYISYTFTKNSALFGRDRDYIRDVDYTSMPYTPRGRSCNQPNLSVNTVFVPANFTLSSVNYAYPGLQPNTFNACDPTDDKAVVPEATRHGALASLSQDLDDSTTIDLKAFYSRRTTLSTSPLTGVVNLGAGNPFAPPGFAPGGNAIIAKRVAVSFSFAPVLGRASAPSSTLLEEWGANAEIKKQLGLGDWQLRGLFNYSHSNSQFELVQVNQARLDAAGASGNPATAINPFNIAATNPALITDLADNEIAGQARDDLTDLRAILDGTLFNLPGGGVKLAVGYEYMHDGFRQRFQSDVRLGALGGFPYTRYARNVNSVFGELQIPIVGADNARGFINSFVVSASGRYDDYSDFGHTFNPKFGATFRPVHWFAIRGNWGTSFTAPTPLDQLGSFKNTINAFPFVAFANPAAPPLPGSNFTLGLQGSQPNLQPQKADTWSVGFDADPPFLPKLHTSVSYYDVSFRNILATPTPSSQIFVNFPNNVIANPNGLSVAQLQALIPLAPGAAPVINSLIASGTRVYEFVDFRTGNFGSRRVKGLDFSATYRYDTRFGGIDFAAYGNYVFSLKQQASTSAPAVDLLQFENSRFQLQGIVGMDIGGLRAQATVNHNAGYAIPVTNTVPVQTFVKSYNTVNLFFRYTVPADSGVLRDLSFTLNVNNVLDQDPPILRRNQPNELGYANGFTLGRLFQFGVAKKF